MRWPSGSAMDHRVEKGCMPSPELFDSPHGSKELVLEEEQAPSGVKAVVTSNIEISDGKKGLHELLERNRLWAASIVDTSPYFFYKLSKQQSPEILWIGCSDSRVPPNQILNLKPGEVFVHANFANEVVHSDMNCLSVIEYAVVHLKVKHIVVCGHYGCSGVKAALSHQEFGIVDNWIRNIKDLYIEQRKKFGDLGKEEALNVLTEANVAKSVYNVCHTRIVQNAWKRGHKVSVHGWCYSIDDGLIRDLNICVNDETQVEPIYRRMMQKRTSVMGFDDVAASKAAEMLFSQSHGSSTAT
ncbi:hypothetical protein H310_01901 [Aphanomyces invadans]|uniref:Carbonic anhydrase n=1 Tax=Aphanomyces invadans TaxID=157072 RepID=A0A024UMG8_9STRA|nr:hypothetical protein H310_01901 [Aphanomyces invadans]ETW07365.1 hypothetical protein H310_01901 [Aphanomyces invadans]|eukprot:XP_008863458.1 hypothetical protein H310_01901 [Aphanomyces invadans]